MAVSSTELKIWLTISLSFFVALMLVFLHLPNWAEWVYPQWLVLVVLYWAFIMPQRVNVGIAWLIGFLLDILYNTPVGENASVLVLITYFIIKFGPTSRLLNFWKKAVISFGLIMLCQLLPLLMQVYLGGAFNFWPMLTRAIIGTLIWLLVVVSFNRQRKSYFESYC